MSELKVDKVSPRTGNYVALNTVGMKNIIINGDMSIAQRGTSTASVTSNGYYACDRWNTIPINLGTWTMSQDTDVPTGQGFATSFKLDCTTADASPSASDLFLLRQKIEGQNLQYLKKGTANAQSLTMSFWVKSNKTGTYIAELFDNDNTRQISKAYTINSASTWEKKTITFAGDTTGTLDNDNANSLAVQFWLGAGSDYSSGTLSTTWTANTNANRAVGQVNLADNTANNFWITGVQIEAGTTASDFEFLPVDVNLQRCLRYYEVIAEGDDQSIGSGGVYNNNTFTARVSYSRKRTTPSLDQTEGTDYYTFFDGGNKNFNSFSNNYFPTLVATNLLKSPGTVSDNTIGWIKTNNASAYVAFDAEL